MRQSLVFQSLVFQTMRRSTLCLRPVRLKLTLSSNSVILNLEIFDSSQIRYPRVNGWNANS